MTRKRGFIFTVLEERRRHEYNASERACASALSCFLKLEKEGGRKERERDKDGQGEGHTDGRKDGELMDGEKKELRYWIRENNCLERTPPTHTPPALTQENDRGKGSSQ